MRRVERPECKKELGWEAVSLAGLGLSREEASVHKGIQSEGERKGCNS